MADITHGSLSSGFLGVQGWTLGIGCPFVTIFAAFPRPVTPLAGGSGAIFFHQRLAFTAS
jgi:hypothetical protein